VVHFGSERLAQSLALPGIVAVKEQRAIGAAIEDLPVLIECSFEDE